MEKTKLYIDITQFISIDALTGIQRVMRELLFRLLRDPALDVSLIVYSPRRETYLIVDNDRFLRWYEKGEGKKDALYSNLQMRISDMEKGSVFFEIDVAWSAVLKRSYLLPILKKQGVILASMIYDILAITHFQYFHPHFCFEFAEYIGAHLLYDDLILVNTNPSRQILLDFAREIGAPETRVEVVPLGGDFQGRSKLREDPDSVQKKVIQIAGQRPYILLVGTIEPRKNHRLLYEAYQNRLKDYDLNIIFAGRVGWLEEKFLEQVYADPDYGSRIYHISDASNEDLLYLYHHSCLVAFPTHMEGYGLPVVEALDNGALVVASDLDVLREVGGDFCVYFKENDPNDFADKVVELLDDPSLYAQKKNHVSDYRIFTWDQTAAETARYLESLT